MSSKNEFRTRSGFTLIELLIVIAIIGTLAALSFPAIKGVMLRAKKAQAKNDVVEIAAAIGAFQSEFGHPPTEVFNEDFELDTILDHSVMKELSSGERSKLNPTGRIFFEGNLAKGGKGGFFTGENKSQYVDPWGAGYVIWIDTDFDGEIEDPTSGTDDKVRRKVLVYSRGHQGEESDPKDWILSWK